MHIANLRRLVQFRLQYFAVCTSDYLLGNRLLRRVHSPLDCASFRTFIAVNAEGKRRKQDPLSVGATPRFRLKSRRSITPSSDESYFETPEPLCRTIECGAVV